MKMSKAFLWVVLVSIILYVLIAVVAVLSLTLSELAQIDAPLAEMVAQEHPAVAKFVSIISVFAIINGVLIQQIMASRDCYGMSKRYGGPAFLHQVSSLTQTPVLATVLIAIAILLFALFFPLVVLAKITSFIILIIFTLVNISLWKMKRDNFTEVSEEQSIFANAHASYPMLAALLCISMLLFQIVMY